MRIVTAFALWCSLVVAKSPNVLIVITDDQGWGDLGAHGNPVIRTPNLDAFAKQSVWLKYFYVSPVCSPTRSSLLTGFYNYRVGVVDTAYGRSMMRPDVRTLPQTLAAKGYRTGLFGKWHLGDNYPLRPEDRGFQTTLWHRGGGLSQPSDPPDVDPAKAYFDSPLVKDGQDVRGKGYCTDVFTDAALEFINAKDEKPFFAYVAYNAPHGPLQVPEEFAAPYRKLDLSVKGFPQVGQPWASSPKVSPPNIAEAYGMIANIDSNFARLMKALDEKKIADDTIVIYLTDNGPGGVRFNAGLRARKGTVYDGGIRVPCYVRWTGHFPAGHAATLPTQHIDITPTLDALTGDSVQSSYDGVNVAPLLKNESVKWPNRTLFAQWHRGDVPELHRCFMAREFQYKLVQSNTVAQDAKWTPKFELFDMAKDEFEQHDLAAAMPEKVSLLKNQYEAWFKDVSAEGFEPPRIIVGNAKENPLRLSRQDWRGNWTPDSLGNWPITVDAAGMYKFTFISKREFTRHDCKFGAENIGATTKSGEAEKSATIQVRMDAGPFTLAPVLTKGDTKFGPDHVIVELVK